MAFSWSEESLPAGTLNVPVNIEYLDKSYIHLYLDDVETTSFTWVSDTLIQLNAPLAAQTKVLLVRRTDKEYLYILFSEGAAFIRENIDTQNTQFLHLAQELTEGRSIEGFFGDLSMNGYRITNLGDPVSRGDAVNKGYVDDANEAQDNRIAALEGTFVPGMTTASYPWRQVVTSETDTLSPDYVFDKAQVYIDGVHQEDGYSFIVVDNTLVFAEPLPVGTRVYAILGENILPGEGYVSVEQFMLLSDDVDSLETRMTAEEEKIQPVALGGTGNTAGNAVSATKLQTARTIQTNLASTAAPSFDGSANVTPGVTGILGTANGGTGNSTGNAASSTKLATARSLSVNLASTTAANFDGTGNATLGVSGQLPIANGGTGASTQAAAQTALDVFPNTGTVAAGNAAAGKVGEVLTASSVSTPVNMTSTVAANLVSLTLTPGDWIVYGMFRFNPSASNIVAVSGSLNTASATFAGFPYNTQLSLTAAGITQLPVPTTRYNVSVNTTVYLVGFVSFPSGTCTGQGFLEARRVR